MKLFIPCMGCFDKRDKRSFELTEVEIKDDGSYQVTCRYGHTKITILQQEKFEVLFEIAAHAILDGYYREAVSSFTASLERFYEFYIELICRKHNITRQIYVDTWRKVAQQSERQLGAFVFSYLLENGTKPNLLSTKKIEFRNDVVHKGKIPTKEEAIDYGDHVLNLIQPTLTDLKKNDSEILHDLVGEHLSEKAQRLKTATTMCEATIISISRDHSADVHRKLSEELKDLQKKRDLFRDAASKRWKR